MAQFDFNDLLKGNFIPQTDEDWELLRMTSVNLFKPKAPIDDEKLFAGRIEQLRDVLDAVYEDGGHAVIFGERGVGKTSLAKIIGQKIAPVFSSLRVPEPVSCGKGDDFYTIWGNAFNNFNIGGKDPATYFRDKNNPYEIYNAIDDMDQSVYSLFIFDEFDRIDDDRALYLMADLLKHYSNNPRNITVVIVGVGNTLLDLFGRHESIARCCAQIKMPRMSNTELSEILDERIRRINFEIDPEAKKKIIKLSQGLPGYVHLLGQLAFKNAIDRRSTKIAGEDFLAALASALDKSDYLTRQDYYKAISSARPDNKYKEVLLACALAKSNELGDFYAKNIKEPYTKIRGRPMEIPNYSTNLSNLCLPERGPALIRSGIKKRYQYRFANPLLQPLVVMIGVNEGLIELS